MPNFAGSSSNKPAPRFTGASTGNFPKFSELVGSTVMLTPVEVEDVPQPKEFGGGLKPRLTADTVILDGEHRGEFPSMWWGQSGIVKKGQEVLRAGRGDLILGTLVRIPKKDAKKFYKDANALEAAFEAAEAGTAPPVPNTAFFWTINQPTMDQINRATAYLEGSAPVTPAEADEDDPFADES